MSKKQANCSHGLEGQDRRHATTTIAVVQKARDGCTTIEKQANSSHGQKAQDKGKLIFFYSKPNGGCATRTLTLRVS
jgi:hypothetical protein